MGNKSTRRTNYKSIRDSTLRELTKAPESRTGFEVDAIDSPSIGSDETTFSDGSVDFANHIIVAVFHGDEGRFLEFFVGGDRG